MLPEPSRPTKLPIREPRLEDDPLFLDSPYQEGSEMFVTMRASGNPESYYRADLFAVVDLWREAGRISELNRLQKNIDFSVL